MLLLEWLVLLLIGAVALTLFAQRLGVPYPAFLAVGGMALALMPRGPNLTLEPELALALFVAPVILDTAYDASLRDLRAEQGLVQADLGGGLIKQRIARAGHGRSGGYRTVVAYRRGDLAVFMYGFAKNEHANIAQDELTTLKELAAVLLADVRQIEGLMLNGDAEEIPYE